ncbi:helix-turn-helix domain-containing protein [Streptomyces sp. RFCAC02]|uniref:winged helix-turn-helix domain-containing protein n=1 Tax=Streptomyces sp. RFCAC02 TaxID=2499143 RepID=UPI00101EAB97|nr:helix-turn-helix domain-containing protein [Streptomyces sp. RFCAC02]
MTEDELRDDGVRAGHPVRAALLDLLAERGTLTSAEAARRLGRSSGVCSFHLRQLARHGLVEEAPRAAGAGRVRPWRLRADAGPAAAVSPEEEVFGQLNRALEDESHRRWLERRDEAPAPWRHDEAFSAVVHLTPGELTEVADAVRAVLAPYLDRRGRPADAAPVAAVVRLFPLLAGEPPREC